MQNKPLLLEIKYSQRLTRIVGFIHALAAVASVMNSLPLLIKSGLLIAVSCHFYWQLKQLKSQKFALKHSDALGWQLSTGGDFETVQILPSTVVSIFALFLHLKTEHKSRHNVVIFNDALAEEDYRHLIVQLKITQCKKENSNA